MPQTDTEQKDVSTLAKRNGKKDNNETIFRNAWRNTLDITACKIRRLMIVWSYEREDR